MKGEILFEKMTGISDEYVMEAALVTPVTAESGKKRRVASLSTAWRRGLSAACICLIVAITAVGGLVAWAPIRDFIEQGNPPSGRFTFYYQTDTPGSKYCTALPGDTVSVDTGLQNEGKAFEASNFFAQAYFVLQSDPSVVLEGEPYPLYEDAHAAVRTIKRGYRENMPFTFIIPEDAVFGVYDLVLSYGEEQQVYKGVLTVGEIDTAGETYPPVEEGHAFSFGFKTPNMQSKLPKDFPIDVHVTNEGEPFTYEGDPDDFSPDSAILYHMESGYEIKGYGTESGRPPKPCNVYFGQKGVKNYTFPIPADAPEGVYGIKLTYRRASESLPNVLIVNDGKVGTYVDRFTFGYEKPDDAYPGDTVSFFTQVANEWDAFTYEGSSSDFAPAATLIHRQTQYRLDGTFDTATDFGTHTVEHWALGNATQVFMIPADAPVGDYDLVLSYGGYSQTFERALTLLDPIYKDLDYPPVSDDHFFTFGIEAVDGFAILGDRIDVTAWVVNQGEPFSFMGDPYTYAPTIILYHMDSDYVIQGHEAPTGVEPRPCNVLTGQKGSGTYTFFIPADAPTGEYGIKLSYNGLESSFDSRLTVAVP